MTSCAFSVFESIDNFELKSYEDALKSENSVQRLNVMNEEMNSLHAKTLGLFYLNLKIVL